MADVQTMEPLYTPQQLAEMWNFDESTIRRWFRDEPGIFAHGKDDRRDGKRQYLNIRIPASVAQRVYQSKLR